MALQAKCHVFTKVSQVPAENRALYGRFQGTRRTTESGGREVRGHTASAGQSRKRPGENSGHHGIPRLSQLNSFSSIKVYFFPSDYRNHYRIFEKYRKM